VSGLISKYKYEHKNGANRVQNSLLFAEMQPILATFVANLARIAVKSVYLQKLLRIIRVKRVQYGKKTIGFPECFAGELSGSKEHR
jgi:CRISPR/Cas system-associated endoribonuclease Cas2